MGRKTFVPTQDQRDMVRNMALAGVQREIIAKCVINLDTERPITPKTLVKAFSEELEFGAASANSDVVAALYRTATGAPSGPQVAAAIFWCKTRLHWRETKKLEFGNGDEEDQTLTIEFVSPNAEDRNA